MAFREGLMKRARIVAVLCATGMTLPLISPLLGSLEAHIGPVPHWLADLGAHWQLLYAFGLAVSLLAVGIASRNPRWAAGFLLCGIPWLTAAPRLDAASSPAKETLVVASANVYLDNADSKPLATWLKQRNADIVIVIEVSERYGRQLEQWQDYPHRKIVPRDSPFGIALLSRHPFESIGELKTEDGIPYLRAIVDWKSRKIAVTALHPMPPLSPTYSRERDTLLKSEMANLKKRGLPSLVAGDLNATVWSTAFRDPAGLGFRSAASPLAPTWPSVLRGWMGIPIDHVVASSHWRRAGAEVGPDIGSDHLPFLATLQLAE
jgi:endonuclease/exonuclease/phosphatase (EEP) superfamily protein YafD